MYKITEWGPGYRQVHRQTNGPDLVVGELAITVEDPTRVLFHAGTQRLVLSWIPAGDKTKMLVVGLEGPAPGCSYNRQDDRLAVWLSQNLGAEITEKICSKPLVDDCRPPRREMAGWLMEGLVRITFDVNERVEPPQFPRLDFEFPGE